MAAPDFGFSFGDFVSAIKIVKDICRALRDTGGAKDEFQHVLIDLQHLVILLEQLNHGVWDHGGDAGHLNAIKGMALTCKTPLQEFLDKMEEYKSLQGTKMGKISLEQTDTERSISTLVRIFTGSKVGVEHFQNLNRAQHTEVQRRFNKLEKMHKCGHVITVSNSEAIKRLEKIIQQLLTYALLREMHCTILRALVFGNQDSIQFTDALGRTEPLPYQYFRHWDIFEAMLRCRFKQLPGEKLVEQGRYHLLDTKRKDLVIDRSRWERSVFPGTGISMSMIILGMLFNKGSCPRVTCGARNAHRSIESSFIIRSVPRIAICGNPDALQLQM
ncbi:uncharacterized protein K444DRAFT_525361 [Hyaloscypha bicolor E]|uniref:Ubiquitin-like domain-containing protein n=1 Tax=Hyaloscypha bicolor E TaxID=1095630 RepID=A0A2J6TGC5_9HELO|nr:uncharacterized protein K444DRAFT_525361 [Hyaloscypha bicolor E]PMD62077.1 hypothetical protein K444DRAFT_525361 [Hyaloscypha bicolor E]